MRRFVGKLEDSSRGLPPDSRIGLATAKEFVNEGAPVCVTGRDMELAGAVHEIGRSVSSSVLLGRLGTPNEIAKAVVLLASEDSIYITRQTVRG